MLLKKTLGSLTLALSMLAASGCSTIDSLGETTANFFESTPAPSYKVAVIPFENLSTNRSAGIAISKLFYSELAGQETVKLAEESWVRNRLKTEKINVDKLSMSTSAKELGEKLGVDRLVLGAVSRYGRDNDLFGQPVVAVSAQLIDVKTGNILWAASENTMAGNSFWSGSANTESLAQDLVEDLADDLLDVE